MAGCHLKATPYNLRKFTPSGNYNNVEVGRAITQPMPHPYMSAFYKGSERIQGKKEQKNKIKMLTMAYIANFKSNEIISWIGIGQV